MRNTLHILFYSNIIIIILIWKVLRIRRPLINIHVSRAAVDSTPAGSIQTKPAGYRIPHCRNGICIATVQMFTRVNNKLRVSKLVYGSIWLWKIPRSSNAEVTKYVCLATCILNGRTGRAAALPPAAAVIAQTYSNPPAALRNSRTRSLL